MNQVALNYEEVDFEIKNPSKITPWIKQLIKSEKKLFGDISYVFCNDNYLHKINLEYLNHDTFTDIITFDYSENGIISGDIFISIERVIENAKTFETGFENELKRVMAHGVLHLIEYKDKSENKKEIMRGKENNAILLFD